MWGVAGRSPRSRAAGDRDHDRVRVLEVLFDPDADRAGWVFGERAEHAGGGDHQSVGDTDPEERSVGSVRVEPAQITAAQQVEYHVGVADGAVQG
jgi:hypothetical protein